MENENNLKAEIEELAENLHRWYLEACKELKSESYNPNAQKSFAELTEEQKFLDRYIAEKLIQVIINNTESTMDSLSGLKEQLQCAIEGIDEVAKVFQKRKQGGV